MLPQFPHYLAAAADFNPSYSICEFWKHHVDTLPHWSAAASKVAVLQPSSAAAERVFSILNRSFNDAQNHTLQDLVETSVMMQFNDHEV